MTESNSPPSHSFAAASAPRRVQVSDWPTVCAQIRQHVQDHELHMSACLVLLPTLALVRAAERAWVASAPSGFAPRFSTLEAWLDQHCPWQAGPDDVAGDAGTDLLTARHWLQSMQVVAPELRDAASLALMHTAWELSRRVASVHPRERAALFAQGLAELQALRNPTSSPYTAVEQVLTETAWAWAAHSSYRSDVLHEGEAMPMPLQSALAQVQAVLSLQGPEPIETLESVWLARWGQLGLRIEWTGVPHTDLHSIQPDTRLHLHRCSTPEDEAERASACVLQALQAGQTPIAVAAIDRAVVRRMRSILDTAGVAVRDETGWMLSTTRAAAALMALLSGLHAKAAISAIEDALHHAPTLPATALRQWQRWVANTRLSDAAQLQSATIPSDMAASMNAVMGPWRRWSQAFQSARTAPEVQEALRLILHESGLWGQFVADEAGRQLLQALRLMDGPWPALHAARLPRRFGCRDWQQWARQMLEETAFVRSQSEHSDVVIAPLAQLWGRDWATVVLAGCDEQTLPALPELSGLLGPRERQCLGLPSRQALADVQGWFWQQALQCPKAHVLWRNLGDGGQSLLPSPRVQWVAHQGRDAADPRLRQTLAAQSAAPPEPALQPHQLALHRLKLSASAYGDLRICPYRYFARRLLGLAPPDEIDAPVGAREWGIWLHAVLREFHSLHPSQGGPGDARAQLDAIAQEQRLALGLQSSAFLPYMQSWPGLRDGYLAWLAQHEAAGHRCEQLEQFLERTMPLPEATLTLYGQLDRVDRTRDGDALLLDYKTESAGRTKKRLAADSEDVQIAFYAALWSASHPEALGTGPDAMAMAVAYLNLHDREGSSAQALDPKVLQQRQADLLHGVQSDMARIRQGQAMKAMGMESDCAYCDVRGLCRKDEWT